MSYIQNLFTSRDNNAVGNIYVGQQGRIWYDPVAGFRVSDGNTPGGTPAVVAVTSANIGNLTIANTTISTVQADANINLVTNGTGNINITGAFTTANTAGNTIIQTLQNGTINFFVPNISYDSAIDIIGTADGTQLYPQNQGVLLHLTGQDSLPARVYSDGVNNYAAYIGRRYNGNATAPTQVLAGETIARYGATPYSNVGWPSISTARVDFVALEDQTATKRGTSIEFYTTPVGTATATPSMTVASTGITNAANILPIIDKGYNLGAANLRWENVYAGQGGLWLADSTTDVETQLSVNSGTFFINGVQSIALGNLVIANTTLETATPSTNIYIGNVADTGYLQIDRATQVVTQNLSNSAALLINGTLSSVVPTEYTNTLFHTVAVPGYNGIHLSDAFGNSGSTNYFPTYEGRAARGNVTNPSASQDGDVLLRIAGAGYGTNTFDTALGTQGGSRIDFRATENYTNTAKGSDIHFWTTAPGTTSTVNSGYIDHSGFAGNSFRFTTDDTVQTTAGIPLTQKANALGVASLDSLGYLTATQIPPSLTGGLVYQGAWDAANNTPTLSNGTGTQGYEYSIGVTGTQNLGAGSVTYQQGGFVIYGSNVWNYVPPSGLFTSLTANTHLSVNQPTGAITISVDATPSLVNSTVVSRNASGSFAANVITATLSGVATSAGTAATVTGNIQSAITQVGTLTALAVSGNITAGNISATNHTGTIVSVTGNISGGNVSGTAGTFTNVIGTLTTAAQTNITSVGTLGSLSVTGNASVGNLSTTGVVSATGNVTGGNILTAGLISATGNITASYFLGNGSQLTGIVSSYGNANVNTLLAAWGSNTVSTTGTITAGNITGGNIVTGGLISATGNVTGGNLVATNNLVVTGNIRYDQASNNATVTQLTSKATAVTCNGRTGQITTSNSQVNKGASTSFTVNNTFITSAKDVVILSLASGATVVYALSVNAVNAAGSFVIAINNADSTPSGSNASDTLVINFAVIKVS